jgi:hypothetical protein
MVAKLPVGTLDNLWADSNNWRADIIYVCQDDPRLIVPKRKKWGGWTVNFAHASAWLLLLGVFLSVAIPATCLAALGLIGPAGSIALGILFIVLLCVLSAIASSPTWYEDAG